MVAAGRFTVGRIARAHGLHGEVVVEILTDAPDRFAPGSQLLAGDGAEARPLAVEASRMHQSRLLLRFAGITTREQAEDLRGRYLEIERSAARPLGPSEFWPDELVGMAVVEDGGAPRGRVVEVVPGAAHDLLDIELTGGRRVLVPAVAALVRVEAEARRVVVQPLRGLLDEEP